MIEHHYSKGEDGKDYSFCTTTDFWECQCQENFIHPIFKRRCPKCKAWAEESPNARVEDILRLMYKED